MDDDDDDDTQSVDFVARKVDHHPGDDESLNSSRSSLQQPSSNVFKGLYVTRQLSNTSQHVHNPVYTGAPANIPSDHRRLSASDIIPALNPNQASGIQTNKSDSNSHIRNNVREFSSISGSIFGHCSRHVLNEHLPVHNASLVTNFQQSKRLVLSFVNNVNMIKVLNRLNNFVVINVCDISIKNN